MYIGMQDQWFTFNMFDAQAWYARDVFGTTNLPDRAPWMLRAKWRPLKRPLPTDEANIRFQADYVERLQAMTDYPTFNIEGVVHAF